MFKVERIHSLAKLPVRSSPLAAGLDLFSVEERILQPLERVLVKTGLKVACPLGSYLRIAPRSGLAWNKGIDVLAGVVDADYRGEVGVILVNLSSRVQRIDVGDRIAQGILERIEMLSPIEVLSLDETERGDGQLGSTGV